MNKWLAKLSDAEYGLLVASGLGGWIGSLLILKLWLG